MREIFGVKMICLALGALWALSGRAQAADITPTGCRDLAVARLGGGATVVSASVVAPEASDKEGSLAWAPPPIRQLLKHAPEFCRIVVRSEPGRESRIGVEVWLPLSGWNGRYLGTGNGGYPLSVMYPLLIEGIGEGYATANTDLGLAGQVSSLSQARLDPTQIFVGRPFALVDFGSRATHEMTWIAKSIILSAYGSSTPQVVLRWMLDGWYAGVQRDRAISGGLRRGCGWCTRRKSSASAPFHPLGLHVGLAKAGRHIE